MHRDVHLTVCGFTFYTVLPCNAAQFAVLAAVNSKISILRDIAITGSNYARNRNRKFHYLYSLQQPKHLGKILLLLLLQGVRGRILIVFVSA